MDQRMGPSGGTDSGTPRPGRAASEGRSWLERGLRRGGAEANGVAAQGGLSGDNRRFQRSSSLASQQTTTDSQVTGHGGHDMAAAADWLSEQLRSRKGGESGNEGIAPEGGGGSSTGAGDGWAAAHIGSDVVRVVRLARHAGVESSQVSSSKQQ